MTVNALILMGVVYGLTEMLKALLPDNIEERPWVKVLGALAISLLAVFLVAETRWAETQFFGDASLDTMDWSEKIVFSIFIAGGAALTQRLVKMGMNFGESEHDESVPKVGPTMYDTPKPPQEG